MECVCYMLQQLVLHLLHSEKVAAEVTLLQQLHHYHHLEQGQEVMQCDVTHSAVTMHLTIMTQHDAMCCHPNEDTVMCLHSNEDAI